MPDKVKVAFTVPTETPVRLSDRAGRGEHATPAAAQQFVGLRALAGRRRRCSRKHGFGKP